KDARVAVERSSGAARILPMPGWFMDLTQVASRRIPNAQDLLHRVYEGGVLEVDPETWEEGAKERLLPLIDGNDWWGLFDELGSFPLKTRAFVLAYCAQKSLIGSAMA